MNQKQSKPNVILIVVDQMRADALSINRSDDLVVTPTLDMMASMGYNFENAYYQCRAVCQQEPHF